MSAGFNPAAVFVRAQTAWDNLTPPEAPEAFQQLAQTVTERPSLGQFTDALGSLLTPSVAQRLHALWLKAGTPARRAAFDDSVVEALCTSLEDQARNAYDEILLAGPDDTREVLSDWE